MSELRSELRELAELREDAAELAREEALARHRDRVGLPSQSSFAERAGAHRLASSLDGLAQACEVLAEAKESGAEKPGRLSRLSGLRDLLVRSRAHALEPGAFEELRASELRPSVELHGDAGLHGRQPIRSIERELGRGRGRGERADMEAALARAVAESDGVRTAAWEAALSALGDLRAGEPVDAAASLHERGWAAPRRAPLRELTRAETVQAEAMRRDDAQRASAARRDGDAKRRADPLAGAREGSEAKRQSESALRSDLEHARESAEPPRIATGAESIAQTCERLLDKTDSLARDLGAWILERETSAQPFPGDAERHDLLQLIHAPRCAPAFPRGELLRTCRRWAEGWRLELDAQKAIRLDEEERPLAHQGAFASPLDPPDEVRVQLFAEEGPWALEQLLSALGAAQLYAGPPANAPPEDLLCHDPAVPVASGAIFSGLVRDDAFRRRCAQAELPVDDARALAIAHVFELRISAAQTLASLEALRSGLGAQASQAHRELFARAALAALPAGLSLRALDPFLGWWALLRGEAFAARTRRAFRERFDEDWWRNPRALQPLRSLWIRGGRPTLCELWSEVAPEETPSIDAMLAELVEACA